MAYNVIDNLSCSLKYDKKRTPKLIKCPSHIQMFETMNLPTYHLERIVKNRMQELNIKFYRRPLPREQQRATASNSEQQRQARLQQHNTTRPAEDQRHIVPAPRSEATMTKETPRQQPTQHRQPAVHFASSDPLQLQTNGQDRRGNSSTAIAPPFAQTEAPPRSGAKSTNPRSVIHMPKANLHHKRQTEDPQVGKRVCRHSLTK